MLDLGWCTATMVIKSPYPDIEIPEINILTYLYGNGDDAADTPLWIDSADDTKSLSAREGLQWIKRLAQGLERAGIKEGEVVMVVSPNHIFVPIAYLGTVAGGRIFSGANPAYNADGKLSPWWNRHPLIHPELSYQMKDAGTRTILVHPSLLSTAKKAATRANLPHTSLYLFSDIPKAPIEGIQDWRSLLAPSQEASSYQWPSLTGSESKTTIATINYSSGTTGLPKGVMISHYNLVANVEQSRNVKHVTQTDDDPSRERWVGFLPLYHAYGQMFSVMLSLKLGIRIYIMQAFEFERFLQVVQDKKITSLQLAPPIAVLLDKHPSVGKYDLSSVETLSCGAAPLASSLQNAISTRFKAPIGQGWGMTEVTCAGLGVPAGVYDDTGSVGQLLPNCEIKLMNEEGGEVKLGERGEIYFRGPNVSPGYWKNEQATRETMLADGWLRTGDVGVANEEGWVWIVDRLKVTLFHRASNSP